MGCTASMTSGWSTKLSGHGTCDVHKPNFETVRRHAQGGAQNVSAASQKTAQGPKPKQRQGPSPPQIQTPPNTPAMHVLTLYSFPGSHRYLKSWSCFGPCLNVKSLGHYFTCFWGRVQALIKARLASKHPSNPTETQQGSPRKPGTSLLNAHCGKLWLEIGLGRAARNMGLRGPWMLILCSPTTKEFIRTK